MSSVEQTQEIDEKQPASGQGWISRKLKYTLIFLAALAATLDNLVGAPNRHVGVLAVMSLSALVLIVLQYRDVWNRIWFWLTVALLALIQVPAIVAVEHRVAQAPEIYIGLFLLADLFFVSAVLAIAARLGGSDAVLRR